VQPELLIEELPALSLAGVSTPRLDDYFGLWHYDPQRFTAAWSIALQTNLPLHISQPHPEVAAANGQRTVRSSRGVALIDVRGSMMKSAGSMSDATSTVRVRQQLREALADEAISGVMLIIDSPGGTHAGTADLAADIRKVAASKPVYAYIEDLAASAGYWIASQATRIFANSSTAFVGSIGTFIGMYDLSGKAAIEGIKPVVIRSSSIKGAGFPGTPITDEQQAMYQGLVDAAFGQFASEVKSGRHMTAEQFAAVSDASMFEASRAMKLGLIDGIQSFEQTLDQLRNHTPKPKAGARSAISPQTQEQSAMSEETPTKPQAATLAELKDACEGADNDFLVEQLTKGATATSAMKAWNTTLQARLQNKDEELTKTKADAEAAKKPATPKKAGHAVGTRFDANADSDTDPDDGDAVATFDAKVRAQVDKGVDRHAAILNVATANPDLHAAYRDALPRVSKK